MSGEGEKFTVRNAEGEILPPGTFFVIRGTDLFAASGLWAYVHTLETTIELNEQARFLTEAQGAHLRNLADQACELATSWQTSGMGRVPD